MKMIKPPMMRHGSSRPSSSETANTRLLDLMDSHFVIFGNIQTLSDIMPVSLISSPLYLVLMLALSGDVLEAGAGQADFTRCQP